jgi:sulfur carrier protein ThiS
LIRVKLAAAKKWMELDFAEGMRIKDVIKLLNYHPSSIALVILNGLPAEEDASLKEGDEIIIVPAVGGGFSIVF